MRRFNLAERRKELFEYVKNEIKRGRFPTYNELYKYMISLKINLNDVYTELGFNMLNFPRKRPNNSRGALRKGLISYVKHKVKKNHFPSRREIENEFGLRLTGLFNGIEDLYLKACSKYTQKNSQQIKSEKASLFMDLIIKILPKLNLKLIKKCKVHERGVDILAKDLQNNTIGVELKAYNKYEMVKKKDIKQIKRFLNNNKLEYCFLITTTSKIQPSLTVPEEIKILTYEKIKQMFSDKDFESLNFIRKYSIHREIHEYENKKKKITEYAKNKFGKGEIITYNSIASDLNLHLYTYFKSLNKVYKEAKILVPFNRIKYIKNKNEREREKKRLIRNILIYIKEEVKKGHYPSGMDIQKEFGVGHIWKYTSMSNLYNELGLKPYHKREIRKH